MAHFVYRKLDGDAHKVLRLASVRSDRRVVVRVFVKVADGSEDIYLDVSL